MYVLAAFCVGTTESDGVAPPKVTSVLSKIPPPVRSYQI